MPKAACIWNRGDAAVSAAARARPLARALLWQPGLTPPPTPTTVAA
eukprot:SAG22_NODE_9344_length_594_cov_1.127273_1_plen_45_part_10